MTGFVGASAALVVMLLAGSAPVAATVDHQARRGHTAPLGKPVRDIDFTFDAFRFSCGTTRRYSWCNFGLGVLNLGSESRRLNPYRFYLHAGGVRYRPWRAEMNDFQSHRPNHLFAHPIPPQGGGLDMVYFKFARGARPTMLEFHEAAGTGGGFLRLVDCVWERTYAGCNESPERGEIGTAFTRHARPGVRYPQDFRGQPICFDRRSWVAVPPTDLLAVRHQGTVSLSPSNHDAAYFHDNGGGTVWLRLDEQNARDARVCG